MHPRRPGDRQGKRKYKKKIVRYHPDAVEELIEAAKYYESQCRGLGDRFIKNVDDASRFVQNHAELLCPDKQGRRKYQVKKFPYLLIYKIRGDQIFILAVAHGRRKPGYWHNRDK